MHRPLRAILILTALLHAGLLYRFGVATFSTTLIAYYLAWLLLRGIIARMSSAPKAELIRNNLRNLFILLLLLEFFFTFPLKFGNTFHENSMGIYVSEYRRSDLVRFLQQCGYRDFRLKPQEGYAPGQTAAHQTDEFHYTTHYNELGLRGKLPAHNRDTGTYRILVLGDSFTEGFGAPEDSTFPVFLEQRLRQVAGTPVSVINAGISGSDPLQAMQLYRDKLQSLDADLVLIASNQSDIYDIEYTLHRSELPAAEYGVAISHIFRLIYWGLLDQDMGSADASKNIVRARTNNIRQLVDSLRVFRIQLQGRQTRFLLLYQPVVIEVVPFKENNPTTALIDAYRRSGLPLADLRDDYQERIRTPRELYQYYWKTDGHHTGKGYALMAEAVAQALTAQHLLPQKGDAAKTPGSAASGN